MDAEGEIMHGSKGIILDSYSFVKLNFKGCVEGKDCYYVIVKIGVIVHDKKFHK